MVSDMLVKSFELTFKIAAFSRVVPFNYDGKRKELSKGIILPSLIAGFAFLLRSLYAILTVLRFVREGTTMDHLQESCLLGLQLIMFTINFIYQVNFWCRRTEMSWMFNQIQDFNKGE